MSSKFEDNNAHSNCAIVEESVLKVIPQVISISNNKLEIPTGVDKVFVSTLQNGTESVPPLKNISFKSSFARR